MKTIKLLPQRHQPSTAFTCLIFLFIMGMLFPLWMSAQKKDILKDLLKMGADTFLGKGQIDSVQVVEENDSQLTLEVRYSKLKIGIGMRMSAEVLDHNIYRLQGFACTKMPLLRKEGSTRLTVTYQGDPENSRVSSEGIQVKLFLTSVNNPTAEKFMEYPKTWIADPNSYNASYNTSYSNTNSSNNQESYQSGEIIVSPEPMFDPGEFGQSTGSQSPTIVNSGITITPFTPSSSTNESTGTGETTTTTTNPPAAATFVRPSTTFTAASLKPTIASFRAAKATINRGETTTLSWRTTRAATVRISPVGTVPVSGTKQISPQRSTYYTLYAQNRAGAVSRRIRVNVSSGAATFVRPSTTLAGPSTTFRAASSKPTIASFRAAKTTINRGETTTLSWRTTGATTVRISPLGRVPVAGTKQISPQRSTYYTLYAQNSAGTVSRRIRVNVSARVNQVVGPTKNLRVIQNGGIR